MKPRLSDIITKGKTLLLAYDHGLEHGPSDFNDKNVDPKYVIDIAEKAKLNGIILQKGIAEKYKVKVPLIIKLNGKTKLLKGDPYAPQLYSVEEAIKLKAKAVGYTIYIGSSHEAKMFQEFEKILKKAHENNLPVILWAYPRGKAIKNELSKEILAYAARIGLELGADIIKMKYNGKIKDLRWIVKCAGKTKVMIAGGTKTRPVDVLKETYQVVNNGAIGMAMGRNIWQYKEPLKMTRALKEIIFKGKTVKQAVKFLK